MTADKPVVSRSTGLTYINIHTSFASLREYNTKTIEISAVDEPDVQGEIIIDEDENLSYSITFPHPNKQELSAVS